MQSMRYWFEIPCPHEAYPSIPSHKTHPNHHPLTRDEIVELLDFARDHKEDVVAVSKAQVRLIQGIPGVTCPSSTDDEVARKKAKLNQIFVDRFELGGAPDLVEVIESFMRV